MSDKCARPGVQVNPPITLSKLPGCSDHDHAHWLIGPVGHTRDSDLIAESNWHVVTEALSDLDPEGIDHEIHRFGHWACGWIEEIAYRPGSTCAGLADDIRGRLEGYPILDEHDLSARECDATDENMADILSDLRRAIVKLDPTLEDTLDDMSDDGLASLAHDRGERSDGWIHYSSRDVAAIANDVIALAISGGI